MIDLDRCSGGCESWCGHVPHTSDWAGSSQGYKHGAHSVPVVRTHPEIHGAALDLLHDLSCISLKVVVSAARASRNGSVLQTALGRIAALSTLKCAPSDVNCTGKSFE